MEDGFENLNIDEEVDATVFTVGTHIYFKCSNYQKVEATHSFK
jgi:hypothetical protein